MHTCECVSDISTGHNGIPQYTNDGLTVASAMNELT